MWYGSTSQTVFKKNFLHNKKRDNSRLALMTSNAERQKNLYYFSKILTFPVFWKYLILKEKNLSLGKSICLLLSPSYYLKIILPTYAINTYTDSCISSISFLISCRAEYIKLFYQYLKRLSSLFYLPFFFKLKFKGKGYYVYKNKRNTITPQFGFSHRNYVYTASINVKFLSKTKIFLFGLSKIDTIATATNFKQLKPINVFTGRGVRFAKQIIYRKTGKISSYR